MPLKFFKFDANDWLTGKIQTLPATQKGIFIDLTARIMRGDGRLKNDESLAALVRVDKSVFSEALRAFFGLKIMYEKEGFLRVKFLDEQILRHENYVEEQRKNGRKRVQIKAKSAAVPVKIKTPEEQPSPFPNPKDRPEAWNMLAPELQVEVAKWLETWQETHGNGRKMPYFQLEQQLENLIRIPEHARMACVKASIAGNWKNIQDVRGEPRVFAKTENKSANDRDPIDAQWERMKAEVANL